MNLKSVIKTTNLVLETAKNRLVFSVSASKLVASVAKQRLVLVNGTKRLTATLLANALNATAVLGKFFEFKEIKDSIDLTETTAFDIDKPLADNFSALEQISLGIDKPLTDSYAVTDSTSLTPVKGPQDTVSGVTDADPIFDITKGIIEIPMLTEEVSFDIDYTITDAFGVTDDLNGAALGDESNLIVFKVLSNNSQASEAIALTPGKGLADSANTSDAGLLRAQDYTIGMTYFAEDYVGQSQSF